MEKNPPISTYISVCWFETAHRWVSKFNYYCIYIENINIYIFIIFYYRKTFVLDMKYSYIIDQQPIGRLLFLQFCEEERHEFHRYNVFLDSIVSLNKTKLIF